MKEEEDLNNSIYYSAMPEHIKSNLVKIDTLRDHYMYLYENEVTKQLWAIDVWDKYTEQMAFKITHKDQLETIDFEHQRKKLLLDSRGGETELKCMWQGCSKKRVKDVLFCIDHLYETGARK